MRLKKLEIRGFKTFADSTELIFTPGITAVVGPNGSGKSNISDAIAWVMGESNVRNLRAAKTQDVIFNGSAKRKAVGLAEVSLTLDNTSGRLPLGFDEVTVTRRAYRSGDSEYFINRTPCRLRDIFELFLDSGGGRGAYSMVSQGEIDRLLTGKPEDRRELLEEAAGVKKYRHRRNETHRKLEHTEDNLSRVADIMGELQAQMDPLADQAETAIRYRDLTERLREIEVGLLVSKVQRLDVETRDGADLEESLRERADDLAGDIEQLNSSEQKAAKALGEAQGRVEEAYRRFSAAQSEAERMRTEYAVAEARKESAEESRRRLSEEIFTMQSRLAELGGKIERSEQERIEIAGLRQELQAKVEGIRERSEAAGAAIRDQEAALAERESGARDMAADRAAAGSRLEALTRREEELARESGALEARAKEQQQRLDARKSELKQAEESGRKLQDELAGLQSEQQKTSERLAAVAAELRQASSDLESRRRTIIEKSTRLRTVRELHESMEGLHAGVRAVLQAAERGKLSGQYQLVANVLQVPAKLDLAIEAALGGAVQDIICPGLEDVREAVDFLKHSGAGRATFLPQDRLDSPEMVRAGKAEGIVGSALDLVSYEAQYEPAVRLLLARVLIAEDMDSAAAAARSVRGWSKIVTLEGEVFTPGGAVSGGSRLKKGAGLIERKREMEELSAQVEAATAEQQELSKIAARLDGEQAELQKSEAAARSRIHQLNVALAQAAAAAEAAKRSIGETEDAASELGRRAEQLRSEAETVRAELPALQAAVSEAVDQGGKTDAQLARQRHKLAGMQQEREGLADELREAASRLSAAEERARSLEASARSMDEERSNLIAGISNRQRQLEGSDLQNTQTGEIVARLGDEARAAQAAFEQSQVELLAVQSDAQEKSRRHEAVVGDLRETHSERDAVAQELTETRLALARQQSEMGQALERLLEDYEITRQDALTWPEPLLVKHGTATEVARLRREIRSMGDVNTGAIAEFERVRERWEFLASQRSDLERAREDLLQTIREIDDSTHGLFMDTFNQVQSHFTEIFTELFGGGMAEMRLTTPENLLETGIEVIVQPPGKKLQNMDLLSGGEKALTAQALLFALIRVRPSPFCVLDEVDAPLDDANVGRFASLVKEYAKELQFIVITHNRATMEAADVLYGVTMAEPGISSLVSARLED